MTLAATFLAGAKSRLLPASMKRTPGMRGSKGVRYFSCAVIESAPMVRP